MSDDTYYPESQEVIRHRLNELTRYLKSMLPPLFEISNAEEIEEGDHERLELILGKDQFETILSVFDAEMLDDVQHGLALIKMIGSEIGDKIEPHMYQLLKPYINDLALSHEDDEEEDYEDDASELPTFMVMWTDLLMDVAGKYSDSFLVAHPIVKGFLNYHLKEDVDYLFQSGELLDTLTRHLDLINGCVLFMMVRAHALVCSQGFVPRIVEVESF